MYAAALEALPPRGGLLTLDADLLLLRPPFVFAPHKYDVRHQTEGGSGCGAAVNTGVLFVRRSDAAFRLLRRMLELAPRFGPQPSGRLQLDQDLLAAAAVDAGATRCALPKSAFAGHCSGMHRRTLLLRNVVTYHATCTADKRGLLLRIAAARAAPECADRPLRGIGGENGAPLCAPPSLKDRLVHGALRVVDMPADSLPQNMTTSGRR